MRKAFLTVVASLATVAHLAGGQSSPAQLPPNDADAVLSAARTALGGERIAAVRTFIANGRTRQIRGDNLVPIEFEIQCELPGRYSRRDEFPAQDTGPQTVGFDFDRLVQIPKPPLPLPDPARAARVTALKQDFARLMLGMFASSYGSHPLTFSYVAQAEAPQGKADVIEAKGPENFVARLFIHGQTRLPIMVSWEARPPLDAARGRAGGPTGNAAPAVERRLYFADHRSVDGLQLPFRLRLASGSDTTEETTFDRFRINARVDPRRFEVNE